MISAPQLLSADHTLTGFDCGKASLNEWLVKRALRAQKIGGSARTFVVVNSINEVVAYYSLSTCSINREDASGKVKRNMPDPIPVILIGRLAVDLKFKNCGIGTALLKDALLRVVAAAHEIGVRAVIVHVLDSIAQKFYSYHGFCESPTNERTLMITLEEISRLLDKHQ